MGLIASTFRGVSKVAPAWSPVIPWQSGKAQIAPVNYMGFSREGYMGNELVYACIEELSTSAAEPSMMVRVGAEWKHEHPLLTLLNRPNPFMDRFEFWATVIMHRSIAGNAYALKVRSRSGKVVELWLLRPDRVRIVPDARTYIARYEYVLGAESIPLPAADVIHFKTRHPLDDFYGMPPLMPISGRVDIDNYTRDFIKAFFQNAGVPAGVLTTKAKLSENQRTEIRNRMRNEFGGPAGWHDMLILDNADASFTPMTSSLGARGLVIPELDEIAEARIPAVFGVPESLIGTRTSYQNGGYANKRAEEQHFWTGTLSPLYKELAGPLNLRLAVEYRDVSEIAFDLSDVRALQDDTEKVHDRTAKDLMAGLIPLEYAQDVIKVPAEARAGMYFIPSQLIPTPSQVLDDALASGEQVPPPRLTERSGPTSDPGVDGGDPPPASGN